MGPVLGFIGAIFLGVGAGATVAYTLAVNLARIGLLALASKHLAPKIDLQQTANDKLLTVKSTVQSQAFVYGQDMLSGPLLFTQVSGDSNQYLHRLLALTGREIESFESFRIDDTDIAIPGGIPDANDTVSAGTFADVVDIATQLGTSTQTVLTQLNTDFASLWTSAHRGRGWSQIYTRMEIVGASTAFEKGVPQNIRALVKGHKVYDPRLDSTQVIDSTVSPSTMGSGAHRVATPSTWAWSNNPALCLADWLIWDEVGMSEETDRIDYELVAKAADICEQQVVVPPAASPSNYQNRYTCNFTFFANQERGQIKSIIESAMLGRCIFSQGKWRMWAGAALTPTITLTEENLAGGIQVEASTGTKQRYNTIRGKFVDPARNYSANPYPEVTDSTYVTSDGSTKYATYDWNACNNSYEAQRNSILTNRMSRNQIVVRFEGNWSCFQIQCGHAIKLNVAELGWSGTSSPLTTKTFMVTEWVLDKDGQGVTLTLVEESHSWADPAVGDYTTRSVTGELVPPDEPLVKLSDATITNTVSAGAVYAGVKLEAAGRARYGNAANVYSDARVPAGEWLGSGTDAYEVLATVTSGTLASGTIDTWLPLTSDLTWYVANDATVSPVLTNDTATVKLDITADSTISPVTVLTSGTYTLGATVSDFMAFRSAGAWYNVAGGDTSGALGKPAGIVAGDFLIVWAWGNYWPNDVIPDETGNWTAVQAGDYNRAFYRFATGDANDDFSLTHTTDIACAQMAAFDMTTGLTSVSAVSGGTLVDLNSVNSNWGSSAISGPYANDHSLVVVWTNKRNNSSSITPSGVTPNLGGELDATIGSHYGNIRTPDHNYWLTWAYAIHSTDPGPATSNNQQTELPDTSTTGSSFESFYGRRFRFTA